MWESFSLPKSIDIPDALADPRWRALGRGPFERLLRAAVRAGIPRARGAGFG